MSAKLGQLGLGKGSKGGVTHVFRVVRYFELLEDDCHLPGVWAGS